MALSLTGLQVYYKLVEHFFHNFVLVKRSIKRLCHFNQKEDCEMSVGETSQRLSLSCSRLRLLIWHLRIRLGAAKLFIHLNTRQSFRDFKINSASEDIFLQHMPQWKNSCTTTERKFTSIKRQQLIMKPVNTHHKAGLYFYKFGFNCFILNQKHFFAFFGTVSLVKLETSCTVIFPPIVSVH